MTSNAVRQQDIRCLALLKSALIREALLLLKIPLKYKCSSVGTPIAIALYAYRIPKLF